MRRNNGINNIEEAEASVSLRSRQLVSDGTETRKVDQEIEDPPLVRQIGIINCLIRFLKICAFMTALIFLVVVVIIPLLLYFCPQCMQQLFFLNFRRMPLTDYENVSSNGVRAMARSFKLRGDQGKIGVWHMLPSKLSMRYRENGLRPSDEEIEETMSKEQHSIVLYAHGNSFDRTISHRCELYNVLSDMDYHVVAFDYRGYGDSDGNPSEAGLVNDTRVVFDYVKQKAGNNSLVVWGHSMGTGVSTKLVSDLSQEGSPPAGLILESPFNNLHDVISHHPFSLPLRWMPDSMFQEIVINPLYSIGLHMDLDKWIANITCPILMLHAADDHVIPVKLARLLKERALALEKNVEYVEFDVKREFRHKFIYKADELPALVMNFMHKCAVLKGQPS
ncbi:hypothetical protein WR25_04837 [Diploscapter pachys]|uniref:Serine aminopeptidase S33 domain-containing protein n=1 Tax=Diploscapter pachys TaxID=2018661 RepID=A0A2A2J7D3_9BILA|nr:hypothetical protein WR25_04837 [Diploscapter pachys]